MGADAVEKCGALLFAQARVRNRHLCYLSLLLTIAANSPASAGTRTSTLLGLPDQVLIKILETTPAQIVLNAGKAAGGALATGRAASALKGASDTADVLRGYQTGGTSEAYDVVAKKIFVKGATGVGSTFGTPGRVFSAAVSSASYDIGKYYVAPWAAPWLADRWIEQDKTYGLTSFGRELRRLEQQTEEADNRLAAIRQRRASADPSKTSTPERQSGTRDPVSSNPQQASKKTQSVSKAVGNTTAPVAKVDPTPTVPQSNKESAAKSRPPSSPVGPVASNTAQPTSTGRRESTASPRQLAAVSPSRPSEAMPQPSSRTQSPKSGTTFTSAPSIPSVPGGISLRKAAAERMPLPISIDGSHYKNGRLVLTGKRASADPADAALLLTALRLACEAADPYFSLDPIDGAAWSKEGQEASNAFWRHISSSFEKQPNVREKASRLSIRTVSARRDYPAVWASMESQYPNLKSKLVFRPDWLAHTRFGQILYAADVLLKELSGGVPVLEPGPLRAGSIGKYASSDMRSAAGSLSHSLDGVHAQVSTWQGHRLWFDLTSYEPPQVGVSPDGLYIPRPRTIPKPLGRLELAPPARCDRVCRQQRAEAERRQQRSNELRRVLAIRGLADEAPTAQMNSRIGRVGDAFDLSHVFPRMFVRRHDHATGSDLPGDDPPLNALSDDVNGRVERYLSAYHELRALTEVFRAYVAAVHIAQNDPPVCQDVSSRGLLDSEKAQSILPSVHPTELFTTVASFEFTEGRARRLLSVRGSSLNGGVAIRARAYLDEHARSALVTDLAKRLNVEAVRAQQEPTWQSEDNRQFLAFLIERPPARVAAVGQPVSTAPGTAARPQVHGIGELENEIENEPPTQRLLMRGFGEMMAIVAALIIVLAGGLVFSQRALKPRGG